MSAGASSSGEGSSVRLREVRYSLPRLMEELQLERSTSNFAKEILDQMAITQVFRSRSPRHARGRKPQVS